MSQSTAPSFQSKSSSGFPISLTLWCSLVGLVVLRAAAPRLTGSWLWGVDGLGDSPGWAWLLWVLSALVLIPPLGRAMETPVARLGRYIEQRGAARWAAAGLAGLVAFLLADQVRFVGDFLLRQGSAEQAVSPQALFSQALQLDVALHYTLPSWALGALHVDPNLTNRILGAVNAAVLALLAVALGRRLGAHGAILIALASVVAFGGWLLLFTGYGKAFAEMSWLVVAAAVVGLDVLRGRRSFLWFAGLVAAALLLHRSALGLLPAFFVLVLLVATPAAFAAPRQRPKRTEPARQRGHRIAAKPLAGQITVAAGAVLVIVALAFVTPRLMVSFQQLDMAHFALSGGTTGSLPEPFKPLRLLDDLNLALFLVPLAPVALLIVAFPSGNRVLKPRESGFLLALLSPYLALALVLQPAQGLYRDFDTLAMSGAALSIVVAVAVASALRREGAWSWLAVAVALGSAAPAVQQMVLAADLEHGLRRIEAWAEGPPVREESVRARTWRFLGVRTYRARQYDLATAYYARAAALAPSPRFLLEWATAAEAAEDWESARQAFERLLERVSEPSQFRLMALVGLASYWERRGDRDRFAEYALGAIEIAPDHPVVRRLAEELEDIGAPDVRSDSS